MCCIGCSSVMFNSYYCGWLDDRLYVLYLNMGGENELSHELLVNVLLGNLCMEYSHVHVFPLL